MNDFSTAIQNGLEASKKADANFEEISSVFRSVNEALDKLTNSKARMAIKVRKPTAHSYMTSILGGSTLKEKEVQSLAWKDCFIEIESLPSEKTIKRIAKIETTEDGYPVTISFDDFSDSCLDKASLESRVADLLSSSNVGNAIKKAMEYSDENDES